MTIPRPFAQPVSWRLGLDEVIARLRRIPEVEALAPVGSRAKPIHRALRT